MISTGPRSAGVLRQSLLLARVWWLSVRRRPRRLGEAPKQKGVPTFLVINLLSIGCIAPLAYATVAASTRASFGYFAWHALGIPLAGLGSGLSQPRSLFQVRGARDDTFLESLPLHSLSRLTLLVADGYVALIMVLAVPLAGVTASGASGLAALTAVSFAWLLYATFVLVGRALASWSKVTGWTAAGRALGYAGAALSALGFALLFFPAGNYLGEKRRHQVARALVAAVTGLAGRAVRSLLAARLRSVRRAVRGRARRLRSARCGDGCASRQGARPRARGTGTSADLAPGG